MNPILVVYKKSAFELYSASSDKGLRNFMAESGDRVERMKQSHDAQQKSLEKVVASLNEEGIGHDVIYRADLTAISDRDLVVSVGGDGTFLEVSHYILDTPILGVNSDPSTSVGYFCATDAWGIKSYLGDVPITRVNRMELELDGVVLAEHILNDVLFAHANPAAVARYDVEVGDEVTSFRNSGLLVSTAAGSTAWMYQHDGVIMPLDSMVLQYATRSGRGRSTSFADELTIHSHTRQGTLFVDGAHVRYPCGIGSSLIMRRGHPLHIVGDINAKRG